MAHFPPGILTRYGRLLQEAFGRIHWAGTETATVKRGVMTLNGVMLPAYAHDEAALEQTVAAVRGALEIIATADREGALDRYLEMSVL